MSNTVLEQSDSLQTPRTTVRRLAARAVYDREAIYAILDEAYICHLGFVVPHESGVQPFVIPTIHARVGDTLYFHGSAASRMLRSLRDEKLRALDAIVEHVVLGRTALVRPPNESEIRQTLVIALPLSEASAKVRT